MKNNKLWITFMLASMLILMSACSGADEEKDDGNKSADEKTETQKKDTDTNSAKDHSKMEHSSSGEVPKDLQKAKDPKFKVGSKAMIETDHMPGMKGAEAKIVGAFDTTAYVVSYDPTTGEKRVKDHKWVIREEIRDHKDKEIKPGSKVTLEADHMKGMKGAEAMIESAKKTTVYMIDYVPTTGGKEVKNHKWVTDDELSSK